MFIWPISVDHFRHIIDTTLASKMSSVIAVTSFDFSFQTYDSKDLTSDCRLPRARPIVNLSFPIKNGGVSVSVTQTSCAQPAGEASSLIVAWKKYNVSALFASRDI